MKYNVYGQRTVGNNLWTLDITADPAIARPAISFGEWLCCVFIDGVEQGRRGGEIVSIDLGNPSWVLRCGGAVYAGLEVPGWPPKIGDMIKMTTDGRPPMSFQVAQAPVQLGARPKMPKTAGRDPKMA